MPFKLSCLLENQDGPIEGTLSDGSIQVFKFDFQVYLPFDAELNKPTGSRRLNPAAIICEKGPHTPLLIKTLCEGQTCPSIVVKWFRIEDDGSEKEYFTTTFEDAKIIKVNESMPLTKIKDQENIGHLDEFHFVARKYTWLFIEKGIEYSEEDVL